MGPNTNALRRAGEKGHITVSNRGGGKTRLALQRKGPVEESIREESKRQVWHVKMLLNDPSLPLLLWPVILGSGRPKAFPHPPRQTQPETGSEALVAFLRSMQSKLNGLLTPGTHKIQYQRRS
ncbi:hypothetical protein LIA77_00065 [Sarocladium implicatum]|nr:hypothetical protein LIA77_00065 [Sarocladium implicatum]